VIRVDLLRLQQGRQRPLVPCAVLVCLAQGDADLEALRVDPRPFLEAQDVALALVKADSPLADWFRSATGWRVELDDRQALLAVRDDEPGCQIR